MPMNHRIMIPAALIVASLSATAAVIATTTPSSQRPIAGATGGEECSFQLPRDLYRQCRTRELTHKPILQADLRYADRM
jgi:hypothetical protein